MNDLFQGYDESQAGGASSGGFSQAPHDGPLVGQNGTEGERHFIALLEPSNNSGAHGIGLLTLGQNRLTVEVAASGLEPNQPHPFHIHGFTDDRPSRLPNIDQDADNDGFVESAEGATVFGSVLLALTEEGPPSDEAEPTAYPTANAEGDIRFERTFTFDPGNSEQASLFRELTERLDERGLQFHGLDVPDNAGQGTGNEVNGTGGYIAGLPVANGIIRELPGEISAENVTLLGTVLPDVNDFLFG